MRVIWLCDKPEAVMQSVKRHKPKKILGNLSVGTSVINQQFPYDIQGSSLSVQVSGTVVRLWETEDAGWAAIRRDDETLCIVCLG